MMNSSKRLRPFLTIGIIILILCGLCTTASAENLLENADFTELDEDGLPACWYTDAYILEQGYSVFAISEGDPEHSQAAVIQNIGENDARFAQTVEVEPESLYLLTGYVKADNVKEGHGANLSVEGVYAFSEMYYDTEGKWEHIEYYGKTGPDQDYLTVFARLGGYSGVSTGKAYFADLSLTKVNSVPDEAVVDRWYTEASQSPDEDETEEDGENSGTFRPWLIIIALLYIIISLWFIYHEQRKNTTELKTSHINPLFTWLVILSAVFLRFIICWLVEGYMVDVNCFLSWGNTMASVGPAGFYEATSFCDYPPLYTYVLALNSFITRILGGGTGVARIAFRFVPCLCDVAGCWMLYRVLTRQKTISVCSCFLFFTLMLFNPAAILNSAAWGQMDSVLCLLLLAVALYTVERKWIVSLPLYVVSVLVKPQALMLGPLGLAYIILTWINNRDERKQLIYGTGISIIVLFAGIIPFSLNQNWDWLIQLYSRTLASYPYATVNTANFYYLLGGNWSAIGNEASVWAPVLLSIFSAVYGAVWYRRCGEQKAKLIETFTCSVFSLGFILCAFLHASWAWTGAIAMCFAFVIVLSSAVRSGSVRMLPWLGGLLYILLYVFGVKMHERYLFPALLLMAAAWTLLKDRRILYVLLLFTITVFVNEGIVLDNSIRLGSKLGHLNNDTVFLADIISLANIAGALYAVWINLGLSNPEYKERVRLDKPCSPDDWKTDKKLHWNGKDTVVLSIISLLYTLISLLTLGSTKAPQTCWTSSSADEQVIFDLGKEYEDFEILYFAQVSRNDFSFSVSKDAENWEEETWAQMDQGQCWKWKYVTDSYYDSGKGKRTYYNSDENNIIQFSGRYVRMSASQLGLRLNEVVFRDQNGTVLPAHIYDRINAEPESELYSDPSALTDEQDTMENLPVLFGGRETENEKSQPSWWNSTYFDEIYHARTAYEFLHASVPYETSHPPLGKVIMSGCVAIFGMTPFGWRFAGAVAGILMLPGMYLLGKQLTKKTWPAAIACLLMALDCMHLTQTQIATIDSFPVLFIIFAYFFMLRFIQTDLVREKITVPLTSLCFSGVFMGLSIASKWIGIYAGAGLAILFFWHCIRTVNMQKKAKLQYEEAATETEKQKLSVWVPGISGASDTAKRTIILCAWCILFFMIVPLIIYLLSYIPYMAYNSKRIHSLWDYIAEVWRSQIGMFNYHSTPNLGMDHPFYSPWWEWPVIGKPMYYASQQYLPSDYPVHHSIFCFGNPVVWYGALAAISVCVYRALRARRYRIQNNDYIWHLRSTSCDTKYIFILIGFLAQYLPWVLVPRGTYIYHYFASLPFLMLSIMSCFDGYILEDHKKTAGILSTLFLLAAAVFFILLFPYASGMNVSSGWLNIGKSILRIWY